MSISMQKNFDFFPEDDLSVDVINKRLKILFEYYKDNGYNVSLDDFKNIFSNKSSNYRLDNDYIYRYMDLFFNGDENTNFFGLVYEYGTRTDSDLNKNPMYETIRRGINIFNNKHISLYEKISLGIYEYIEQKKQKRDDEVVVEDNDVDLTEDKQEEIMNNSKNIEIVEENNEDISLQLSKLLGSYDIDSDSLLEISDLLVRCNLYYSNQDRYLKYSKDNNYQEVLGEVNRLKNSIAEVLERITLNDEKIKEMQNKKTGIFFSSSKKNDEIMKLRDKRNLLLQKKEILENRCLNLKREYIGRFYYDNQFVVVTNNLRKYGLENLANVDKLFGIFEFEDLPIDNKKINNMDIVRKNKIIIPEFDSAEFREMVKLSLEYLDLCNKKKVK